MRYILTTLSILISLNIYSLHPNRKVDQYIIEKWSDKNGLPQNSSHSIVQTSDGYIWFGTEEGLVKFDGIKFTTFDTNNHKNMKFNDIQLIVPGDQGDLWIGGFNGLFYYKDGEFKIFKDKKLSDNILSIIKGKKGEIWIGTQHFGIIEHKNGEFKTVPGTKLDKDGEIISMVQLGKDKGCYVTSYDLRCFDNGENRLVKKFKIPLRVIFLDSESRYWIGTAGKGLFRSFDLKTFEEYSVKDGILGKFIRTIYQDRSKTIWIGTYDGGVTKYQYNRFESLKLDDTVSVISFYEDYEGSLWVGTSGHGLFRLKDGKVIVYTKKHGFDVDLVISIVERSQGGVWIGSFGGGVYSLHNGEIKKLDLLKDEYNKGLFYSIFETKDGALWCSIYGKGVIKYKNKEITLYNKKNGLHSERVRVVYGDKDGNIWLGSQSNGVAIIGKNGDFIKWDDGKKLGTVRAITQLTTGEILIGSDQALYRVKKIGEIEKIDGLSDNYIFSIMESKDGAIWVTTNGAGVNRISKNGDITVLTRKHGLPTDTMFTIMEDRVGDIWLSSNKGITHIQKEHIKSFITKMRDNFPTEVFGRNEGLLSPECIGGTQYNSYATKDGKLYFATDKGVVLIDPEQIFFNEIPPKVHIEKFIVDNKTFKNRELDGKIILKSGSKNMEIHYTGLSYLYPKEVIFKYRLKGYDNNWKTVKRRVVYYTNLSPKEYVFELKALNNDGVLSEKISKIFFKIKPYFYQTLWFKIALAFAIFFTIFIIFYLRSRAVIKQNQLLEKMVNEKTKELSKANKELLEMSLKDPLTGLQNRRYFSEVLKRETETFADNRRFYIDGKNARAIQFDKVYGIFMIDMDHFKQVNDSLGHDSGDMVLKQLAKLFIDNVRIDDVVTRWGGEEFMIVLKNCETIHIPVFAEKLRSIVENHPFEVVNNQTIKKTCSIGVVKFPVDDSFKTDLSFEQAISIADLALYYAKTHGRNQWVKIDLKKKIPNSEEINIALSDIDYAISKGYFDIVIGRGDDIKNIY